VIKPSGVLAILLSAVIPGSAFGQNFSAAQAGASAESGAAGAAGAVTAVPSSFGALNLSLSAPSVALGGLAPVPGVTPTAQLAAISPGFTPIMNAAVPAALVPVRPAAATAQPLKPAAVVPAALAPTALRNVPEAPAKGDQAASTTWTEKIAEMFDGDAKKAADEAPLDPATIKTFLVRHGQPMIEIGPGDAIPKNAQIRLLTAKNDPTGLGEKHAAQVAGLMKSAGVNSKVQQEALGVSWAPSQRQAEEELPRFTARPSSFGSKLLKPFREAKFLGMSFAASLVKPTVSEIMGGIATKSFPLVTSIGVYWAAVGLAHPFVLGGLIGLSLTQEIFHGFFLKSWNNFQETLRRERGFNYQMFFNLAYMQGFGTIYRLLSWTANPSSITPPWSVHYWKDMAVMSVAGTFFGVLGYNSLNALYAKGSINRWQHSAIQQVRDLGFLLASPFFASGSMTVFWGIFLFQQSLDLAISIWAGRAKARPIVFVTSAAVAGSAEFKAKYPVEGVVIEPPLKQAVKAVVDNPLVRLMTWPARALWKLGRGGKK
jgi:hypothetical protein